MNSKLCNKTLCFSICCNCGREYFNDCPSKEAHGFFCNKCVCNFCYKELIKRIGEK